MGVLDRVLGFLGKDNDDLEATQSAGRQRFGGAADPLGFLTSEFDPVASANSLAGPVYSDSMTGKSYVSEPDTDPRTDREIITDTAGAVSDAVIKKANEPWKQPQFPSAKQTFEFAKNAATETVDLFDRLASGDASLLEVLEAATGVGLGAKVAQKAFPDPELDDSSFTTGMFLNQNANNADTAALDRAKIAESNGVGREAIYKDTGWFKFADEWLFEISDKDSNIKLLQKFKKPLATIEEVEVPTTIGKEVAEQMRLSAMKKIIGARTDLINGDISEAEFEALSKAFENQYKTDLASSTGTKIVRKETNPETPAKDKGILSEVLVGTDELTAALPPGTMDQTAQIKGRSKEGYFGVKYGGTPPPGYSKVNTFPGAIRAKGEKSGLEALVKDLAFAKVGNADQELLDLYKTGKITKDQFYADLTWGVMLHETQHLVQEALSFKSGRGGTQEAAKDASKEPANQAVRDAMKELAMQDGWTKTKSLLKQYKQKGDQRNTGQAFVSLLTFRRNIANINQDPKYKNNDEKSAAALIERTTYVNKIRASFPALNAADSTAFALDLINDSDILDSTEVFDRIMVSRAGRLSDSTVTPAVDRDRYRLFPKSESKNPTKENIRYGAYSHIAGEALARLVTARRNLSTEQLRDNFPLNDLDVEEGMMFRIDGLPEDYSIDTTPPPRTVETPEPPAIKPSVEAEPDPQTIISVMDKDYFAAENLNDADLRLKDPVGYVAGDILRFIEYFPNGATLKAIQGELIDGSPDPNSKDFFNKTQKKANGAFYTDERLQEALVYIDNNGLADALHKGKLLADSTQIFPIWQRKKPDGTVLTREDLGYPPWPPVDPKAPTAPTIKPNSDYSLEGLDNQIVAANFMITDSMGETALGITDGQMLRSYPVAFRAAEIMEHIREYDNLGVGDRVDLNQTLSDLGFGYWKRDLGDGGDVLDELNLDPVELDDNAIEALIQNGYIEENEISGYTIKKVIEAPDAGSIDDQMDAGAMGSGPPDGGDRIYPQGSVFTSKTFDAMNFSDEQVAEMARVHKGIKSDFTDADRDAEQKRIDEKRDRLIEQYITAFTNTLASKGDKVVDLKSLKYAMKKDNALGGIEAAARQAADTNVILERMAGDIMDEEAMAERFVSMLEGPLFVGPKVTEGLRSYLTTADIDKADPEYRETVRRMVEGDFSLNADQEEFFDHVYDEGYNNELLEWASTEHAIRSTLKKMQIPTFGDN